MTVAAHIVAVNAKNRGARAVPVTDAVPVRSATLTASASSQAFNLTAPAFTSNGDYVWLIENGGSGSVWVRFYYDTDSPAPDAAAGSHYILAAGTNLPVTAAPGQRCAIINA